MRVEVAIIAFTLGALATIAGTGFWFGYASGVSDTRARVVLEKAAAPKPAVPSNRCYLKGAPHANA